MSQAMVTVAAPIASGRIDAALRLIRPLGNPASPVLTPRLDALQDNYGVHFASLHALPSTDPRAAQGHLVLEFTADGDDDAALDRIVACMGGELGTVFALAADRGGGTLRAYLGSHKLTLGQGWFGRIGLPFAGTPGMSVGRIRREADLARAITPLVGGQKAHLTALARLELVRAWVRADPALTWALETPDPLPVAPNRSTLSLIAPGAVAFIRTYLWPAALLFAAVVLAGAVRALWVYHEDPPPMGAWDLVKMAWSALMWLLGVLLVFAVPVIAGILAVYLSLRAKEQSDWRDERAPRREVLKGILEHENQSAQNHMVSITTLKPGLTRRITVRFAFWIIGFLATLSFKPGHLGDIGTIHFARWVRLPGGRDFVFFSNYGGSWESYLEDFITKAHEGLTAVWSNTVGFPRTENLFQKGATDGERFKRFARRSMLPTPFWYSAYPELTTANIRTNAAIRCGLAAAVTDAEAVAWLALFGSAERPAPKLESDQIQSLVFGGLGFMPHGEILLIDLADDTPKVRGWLAQILPRVAFDDGRRLKHDAVLTLALGPGALAKAGLPDDAVESFPAAFLDGMTGPGRARILGDDPETPWWWRTGAPYDLALLVYGRHESSVAGLAREMRRVAKASGHTVSRAMPLNEIPSAADRKEPFGFLDGVSQPVIRGTYRGLRNADPIHLVEPGEFILGYPDNRGNSPPGPVLKALDDPDNRLPIRDYDPTDFDGAVVDMPREIGRNGSFLVIRQLEQDTEAFHAYCDAEAQALQGRLGAPYVITGDFIGAKLVGRWPDGSSLARNPYTPFTGSGPLEKNPTRRPESSPANAAAIAPPPTPAPQAAIAPVKVAKTAAIKAPAGPAVDPGDNDFLLGTEDPQGLRCPFGAHIRRANPRDSLDPGSQDQIDISNRHRIIRVGRTYVPQEGQKPGLMFMCLNGDIERQFEFVQQTWLGSETFHGLSGERDPLAGNRSGCPNGYTIPTRDGPVRLKPMSRFVTPRGGGYFFLPGKRLLEFLSG